MKFSGEGFGWKAPKNEERSDEVWDLEEGMRRLENEKNLAGMHIEYLEGQKEELGKRVEELGIDALTGVLRREIFKSELDRVFAMIRNEKPMQRAGETVSQGASLVFIDLDKFKQVNDTHGHLWGDDVLRRVGTVMKEVFRTTDSLGRYGGDEFIALLPNTNEEDAVLVAEKLRTAINTNAEITGLGVTASIGVCSSETSTADDSNTFIKHADEAAYFAKREGGNRVEVYK